MPASSGGPAAALGIRRGPAAVDRSEVVDQVPAIGLGQRTRPGRHPTGQPVRDPDVDVGVGVLVEVTAPQVRWRELRWCRRRSPPPSPSTPWQRAQFAWYRTAPRSTEVTVAGHRVDERARRPSRPDRGSRRGAGRSPARPLTTAPSPGTARPDPAGDRGRTRRSRRGRRATITSWSPTTSPIVIPPPPVDGRRRRQEDPARDHLGPPMRIAPRPSATPATLAPMTAGRDASGRVRGRVPPTSV